MNQKLPQPGPWAIYPEVMATSTGEVERHAMIWFDDNVTAEKYAAAESAHVGIAHRAYLATPPKVHFVQYSPGIMIKGDDEACGRLAQSRLNYPSKVIAEMA